MRTLDVSRLNALANKDSVRPWLGGEGPVDLAPLSMDLNNYIFECDTGGFVVAHLHGTRYEAHTISEPGVSPRPLMRLLRKAMEYMFTVTDCTELVTRCPEGNAGASALADYAGFRSLFMRGKDDYRIITLDEWASSCSAAGAAGEAFHDALEAAKEKVGSSLEVHEDDQAHDRYVGAAFLMIKAGNVQKGVDTYNRWASFAGYAQVEVVSLNPTVVDVVDALVTWNDGLEILKCR